MIHLVDSTPKWLQLLSKSFANPLSPSLESPYRDTPYNNVELSSLTGTGERISKPILIGYPGSGRSAGKPTAVGYQIFGFVVGPNMGAGTPINVTVRVYRCPGGNPYNRETVPYKTHTVTATDVAAAGSELITNGDFAADTDWIKGPGWSIAAGAASFAGGPENVGGALSQPNLTQFTGLRTLLAFTTSGFTSDVDRMRVEIFDTDLPGNVYGKWPLAPSLSAHGILVAPLSGDPPLGGITYPEVNYNGGFSSVPATPGIRFVGANNGTWSIDNVSLMEMEPNRFVICDRVDNCGDAIQVGLLPASSMGQNWVGLWVRRYDIL